MEIEFAYVKQKYFLDHPNLLKMLDYGDVEKQCRRLYLFLKIFYKGNTILIPLRNRLQPIRKFGIIGHAIPSAKRTDAGLDYRYILVINDEEYLESSKSPKISKSQIKQVENNINIIEREVIAYIEGFIKVASKNRIDREPKYKESSLINFQKELGVIYRSTNRNAESIS